MKKIFIIFTIGLLACSCSFLEEKPYSSLTKAEAYGSMSLLKQNAVLSVYQYIGGSADSEGLQGTGRGVYDLNSLTTDEQIMPTRGGDWYDGGYWQRLYLHEWTTDDQTIRDTWNYLYKVVMLCTHGIEEIKAYAGADKDDEELQALEAELRALRAMYYYYLMDLYGRVALISSSDMAVREVQLSERKDVYNYIINELAESMPLLKKEYSNSPLGEYYGRMTYYVAAFVMMKLALNQETYIGSWDSEIILVDENGISSKQDALNAVIQYADILSSKYSLEDDLSLNFSLDNERSKENIFVIPREVGIYSARYNYIHRSLHYNHASAIGIGGENGASATLATLEVFGYGSKDQDPRFDIYFYYDTIKVNGKLIYAEDGVTPLVYEPNEVRLDLTGTTYEKTAGARLKKYENDPNGLHDATEGKNDIVLFRYADVVLMKAEAMVRSGKDGTAEIAQIRSRAGAKALESAPTLNDIYEERWRELMWEGWHRNDMIRFGKYDKSDHTTVFPIPQDIIDIHPNWKQNEGY